MKQYVTTSLETHLFFGRIMKEHSFFLMAGFMPVNTDDIKRADWFRIQFEESLVLAVRLSNGNVDTKVLDSGEVVTEFTQNAEMQTSRLTGIPIKTQITRAEKNLKSGCLEQPNRALVQEVRRLNQRNIRLLNGLIAFKERILRDVGSCTIFTVNYPLLIEHILREAKLYREILLELERCGWFSPENRKETELFWNQIMMEHAEFIRGLLDPTECELMETADHFACEYKKLLTEARKQDCKCTEKMAEQSEELTREYQKFKTAGTKGITECRIRSIILPLLADHVLREANHYLRILECKE